MSKKVSGMRAFYIIWFGQVISTLGSSLTSFALGVWIYERTDSVTLFTINAFIILGVSVAVSPFAGALVDRWNRRWVMIVCDTGAAATSLVIWLLLANGNLQIWHILMIGGLNAGFSAFQWPAHSAATTMLVPKEQLGRAGGMDQIGEAIANLVSPALAGFLYLSVGMNFILMADFVTFLFAVGTLLLIYIPEPERTKQVEPGKSSIFSEIKFGWNYITDRKGLLLWMLYIAGLNTGFGLASPLLTPLMLDMGDAQQVGFASSVLGLGMLLGTLVMSAWGGPKRRVFAMLGSGVWMGISFILIGASPSLLYVGISGFLMMVSLPILNANSVAMWQTKVPPDIQGRVFSVRRVIGSFTYPVATLISGPLVENILQPLMNESGALSAIFGRVVGSGNGRGTALLFVFVGIFMTALSLLAFTNKTLLNTEMDIPDAVIIEKNADPLPAD